jgi:integrase
MEIKLLDRYRLNLRNLSPKTIEAYTSHARRFIAFHHCQHPASLPDKNKAVEMYLAHLAVRKLSPQTSRIASAALGRLFAMLNEPVDALYTKLPVLAPDTIGHTQALLILGNLHGEYKIAGYLAYGSGLTAQEIFNLTWDCFDFRDNPSINVGRVVPLAQSIAPLLAARRGLGEPPCAGNLRSFNYRLKVAGKRAGILTPVTAKILRHSFIRRLFEAGYNAREIQEATGHTSIYAVLRFAPGAAHSVKSPVD